MNQTSTPEDRAMAADWTMVPMDFLLTVAPKFKSMEDFIYFSVVCRWWNDISSIMKDQVRGITMPWLLLAENKNENPNPNCLRKIFSLRTNKCYNFHLPEIFGSRCWGSSGWVVVVERDLNVLLFNPIDKTQIRFPSSETIPNECSDFDKEKENDIRWILCGFFIKVVVLKVSQGENHEFVIAALTLTCLTFAGHKDQSWTILLNNDESILIVDIVAVEDKLFALYLDGKIVCWNFKDFHVFGVAKHIVFTPGDTKVSRIITDFQSHIGTIYLVHLDGEFIMVLRDKTELVNSDGTVNYDTSYETCGFEVFKLNQENKSWEEIKDLGGATLFVGGNSSTWISATSTKIVQGNYIYFTDDQYDLFQLPTECGGYDMGFYDMKSKKLGKFYESGNMRSPYCPPTWFIPQF